jgi:hypothetical protein
VKLLFSLEFPGLGFSALVWLGGVESESPPLFTGIRHCLRLMAAAIPKASRFVRPGSFSDASGCSSTPDIRTAATNHGVWHVGLLKRRPAAAIRPFQINDYAHHRCSCVPFADKRPTTLIGRAVRHGPASSLRAGGPPATPSFPGDNKALKSPPIGIFTNSC